MKMFLKIFTMLFCVSIYAQTTVKGTVKDEAGVPLPGANVVVVGTATGAVTDFDGVYTLTVDQDPPFSIQVTFTGFQPFTAEVTANNQTIDVTLLEGTELDDVVISA